MKVKIRKLHNDAIVPKYAKEGDAGMDLYAVSVFKDVDALTGELKQVVIDSGVAMEIPEGFVGLVFPRSSIRATGLRLSNSVGVIDSGYRGPLKAVFDVIDDSLPFYDKGDRFAQIIIIPHPPIVFEEAHLLSETERGEGGFGSTGA